MQRRLFTQLFTMIAFTLLGASFASAQDSLRIMSGGLVSLKHLEANKAAFEKVAGMKIESSTQPADIGMVALSKGLIDAFLGSRPAEAIKLGEKRGMEKQNPDDYLWTSFTKFHVKFAIHPDNSTTALTKEQFEGILSGRIKSWEPINGQKTPITLHLAKNYINTNKTLLKHYIKAETSPVAHEVIDREGLLKAIKANPGAVGVFGSVESLPDFKPKYILSQAEHHVGLLTKKAARAPMLKLFEHVKSLPVAVVD